MKTKKRSLFSDILNSLTKYFLVLVVVVILVIAFSGVRVVESGNVAVVLRFGRLVGNNYDEQVHQPGLLWAFPYIIDEVVMVPTGSVIEQTVNTHYTNGNMSTMKNNGYVITGDSNIAIITASVKYMISDPVAYALNVKDIGGMINAFVSSAMVSEASSLRVDDLLTSQKDPYARAVLDAAQSKLNAAGAGVMLGTIELTEVSMPEEVRVAYEAVISAKVNAETMLQQANQYANTTTTRAETEKNSIISSATINKNDALAEAVAALAEFNGTNQKLEESKKLMSAEEYENYLVSVKAEIYYKKLNEALGKIGTVRVVQDGDTKIFIGE